MMVFRSSSLFAVLLLSCGIAAASPLSGDPGGSNSSSSGATSARGGAGLGSSPGILTTLGITGAFAAVSMALHNHSAGERTNVPVQAPEISTSGVLSGLTLLLGGGLIVRGRRRAQV